MSSFSIPAFTVSANVDNALATAAQAADPKVKHCIRKVSASFEVATDDALLQIKVGSTVVWEQWVTGKLNEDFPEGLIMGAKNEAVSAELAASGSAGNFGYVSIGGQSL